MYKVQLTLTPEETTVLQSKAQQLGYSVAKFIKLLIGREVLETIEQHPVIKLSDHAIDKIEKAHQEHAAGKTITLKTINDLDVL